MGSYSDNVAGYRMRDPFKFIQGEGGVSQGGIRRGEFTALAQMPYDMMQQYRRIADEGIYGGAGIADIMGDVRRGNALRTQAIAKGMRRKFGRRLGSRSGAVMGMLTNRLYAPQQAQRADIRARLKERNYESRESVGLENIQSIMRFLQQRYGERWWEKMDKGYGDPGVLGTIGGVLGPLSSIASLIPGVGPIAGAAIGAGGAAAGNQFQNARFDQGIQRNRG